MSRILIVDDNEDICLALARLLRRLGYEVVIAPDGDAALAALRERPIDLTILDIMMPKMDGLEVLHRVKADPATAHIPVVVCSAVQDPEAERAARAGGAADFWLKATFDFTQLADRVTAQLAARGA
jgi:CheY-like chemotaxis protein